MLMICLTRKKQRMIKCPYIKFNSVKQNWIVVVNSGLKIECSNHPTAMFYKDKHSNKIKVRKR
jgi:hypothetical protein